MTRIKAKGKCETSRHLVLGMSMAVVLLILGFPSVSRAATLTVNSTGDAGGTCPGAGCTLRQAIATAVSGDTINFSLPANSAITLTSGELSINKNLTISGPGANLLSVQRSAAPGTPAFRIFNVVVGAVTISGLAISNGMSDSGGGLVNVSKATIINCAITGNSVSVLGGGILNSGSLIVTNSTISGNSAAFRGGGISDTGGLTITNSTISGNDAVDGGGISSGGAVVITNSTIAGNTASDDGGGIYRAAGEVRVRNTIIALNTAPAGPDVFGALISQGYNLFGNTSSTTITGTTTGNQLNVNPLLGPLQDNGGPTRTYALLSGSTAIEGGHSSGSNTDQRGRARPVDSPLIPNATGGDGSDIGAYEVQADQLPGCSNINRIVNNNNDGGTDSLRAVIANVCAGSTITFAPNVTGAINLTSGELAINKTLTINGPGANLLTVQRSGVAGNFRIFNIASASVIATISGLTIANGNLPDCCFAGGGIGVNLGALILTNSTLSGNAAFSGGGISNTGGTVTIMNSTISGNTALGDGGGFLNSIGGGVHNSGTLTITNSTLSGNVALDAGASGAGIYNDGETTLANSTISGNSATAGGGGGVHNFSGTVRSRSTIVALNTAAVSPDFAGALTSEGFNLIGNNSGATIAPAQFSDQIGTPGSPINPMLGPLQNNGGPTLTRALLAGSTAIDKGTAVIGMTTDQRGSARPYDYPSAPNAPDGDGSDIGAFERQPTDAGSMRSPFDFDGDGKTDIGIFRPAPGEWWINRSSNGTTFATQFGASTDIIAPGDFTGDGKADIAFFRPSTGFWFVLRSEDFSFFSFPFGTNGDIPAPADFDGDAKADVTVFRPSTATWFINRSTGGTTIQQFGANGDRPIAADYDGDGRADIAIYRPSVAEWWMLRSSAGVVAVQFGLSGDKALPGDFTGDGKADVAFWRPSTGFWFVLRSEDFSFFAFPFGINGDLPASGDYDGDGRYDPTIFRPSSATWFINRSTGGTTIVGFGAPTDAPIPAAFVR